MPSAVHEMTYRRAFCQEPRWQRSVRFGRGVPVTVGSTVAVGAEGSTLGADVATVVAIRPWAVTSQEMEAPASVVSST